MKDLTLAVAFANAGKALLDLADALDPSPTPGTRAPDAPPDLLPFESDYATEAGPTTQQVADSQFNQPAGSAAAGAGSASVCPSHNIAYLPGRKGPYCPAQSTEPNWSYVSRKNGESYCAITPKSAAAWLRQHA